MSRRSTPRRGEVVLVKGRRGAPSATRSTAIDRKSRLRLLTRGHEAPTLETWRRGWTPAISYRESLGIDATAYRLVHGEADRLPSLVVDRYGDYLVAPGARRRASIGCCRRSRACSSNALQPAGILARNDPRVRLLEGLEQRSTCCTARCPRHRGSRRAGPVSRRSVPRPEDRAVSRSAREPRGRRAVRAGPAARRLQLQRRLRAGAWRPCATRCSRSTSRRTRCAASARTPRATALTNVAGARDERLRRAARARAARRALRHDRARSAGVRQEQGVGRRRRSPATRRSTCGR